MIRWRCCSEIRSKLLRSNPSPTCSFSRILREFSRMPEENLKPHYRTLPCMYTSRACSEHAMLIIYSAIDVIATWGAYLNLQTAFELRFDINALHVLLFYLFSSIFLRVRISWTRDAIDKRIFSELHVILHSNISLN